MGLLEPLFQPYTAMCLEAMCSRSFVRRQFCRTGPIKGCVDSSIEWTRWTGKRNGPLLDALQLSCRIVSPSTDVVDGDPRGPRMSCQRRPLKPAACSIDGRIDSDHRRASDVLVRCTTVIAAQLTLSAARCLDPSAGRSSLALRPLESFRATLYPLSTLPWDLGAKRSTGSEQMASWFSG